MRPDGPARRRRITEFPPRPDELITEGLVTVEDVHVDRYVNRAGDE